MFKTVKRIIDWCGEFKGRLYAGFVVSFFSHLFTALPIMLAAYTIGLLLQSAMDGTPFDTGWVWKSLILLLVLVFLRFLFDYLRTRFQEAISYELVARDRLAVGDALKRVSLGYFQQVSTGNILNSLTTGLGTLEGMGIRMIDNFVGGYLNFAVVFLSLLVFSPRTAVIALAAAAVSLVFLLAISHCSAQNAPMETTLAHLFPEMTANIAAPVLTILYLFVLDWRLALLSLVVFPVAFFFMMTVMGGYGKDYAGAVQATTEMSTTLIEYINGIEVIKAFNQGSKSYAKLTDKVRYNAQYYVNWMKKSQLGMAMAYGFFPAQILQINSAFDRLSEFNCQDSELTKYANRFYKCSKLYIQVSFRCKYLSVSACSRHKCDAHSTCRWMDTAGKKRKFFFSCKNLWTIHISRQNSRRFLRNRTSLRNQVFQPAFSFRTGKHLCPVFSESAKCFCRTFPNSKRRCDSLPAQRTLYFVPLTSKIQDVCFCAAPAGMAHHAHRTAKSCCQKRCILYIRNSSAAKLHFPVLVEHLPGSSNRRAVGKFFYHVIRPYIITD